MGAGEPAGEQSGGSKRRPAHAFRPSSRTPPVPRRRNGPFSPESSPDRPGSSWWRGRAGAGWCGWGSCGGSGRGVSESVAKALRAGIGREKKRGISTFLLARFGATRVFATDSDNRRHQGPRRGAAAAWAAAVTSAPAIPRAATPARPSAPDASGAQTCTSHSKVQFQPLFSSAKCTSRRGVRPADALDRELGARSGSFRSRGASTPGSPWGRGGRAAAPRRSPRR